MIKRYVALFVILTFILTHCHSPVVQKKNAYLFIEPNVSLSYDSSLFHVVKTFENDNGTSYDFIMAKDPIHQANIHLEAAKSSMPPEKKIQDSMMLGRLAIAQTIGKSVSSSLNHVDEKIRHLNGFSCFGFTMGNKSADGYSTTIEGVRLFENSMMRFFYSANNQEDLLGTYEFLNGFLGGIRSYTPQEISKEDSLIRNRYTVVVDSSLVTPVEKVQQKISYVAMVHVQQPLQHTLQGAMLKGRLFTPDTNGQIRIPISDYFPGKYEHKGELLIRNALGKKVSLPFTVAYFHP